MPDPLLINPLEHRPQAVVQVPGSKSHSNRALLCAALARGESLLDGVLFADDTEAMIGTLQQLGIDLDVDRALARIRVTGCAGQLPPVDAPLDVRQSGTTGRFLLPALALGIGRYVLDGDEQLRRRPFSDLLSALRQLGVEVEGTQLPLAVLGGSFVGGEVEVAGSVSSQFLSGLLLSAPAAQSQVSISVAGDLVSKPYIELTLSTMRSFGATVDQVGYDRFIVATTGYEGSEVTVEPDASAASYFFAAAAITGGTVRVPALGTLTVQGDMAFVDVLERMGAVVTRSDDFTEVTGPGTLMGVDVDLADFSDTAQTLAIVATFASTPTTVTGIGFIRQKETDRIDAVVTELRRLGIDASEQTDGFVIRPGTPTAGIVDTRDDHRMAMSFALLGLCHPGIAIGNPQCVNKTFPTYFEVLEQLRVHGLPGL